MQLIKTSAALGLADADGFVLFGGKSNRKHPMPTPVRAKPILKPHGVVDWEDENGKEFLRNRTGTLVWAAATSTSEAEETKA
ncbi:hypothetical protein ACF06W_11245 [Streptomyces albus]|uniref:hypothetical protein n=1 Tax=Streptomyces albus TaxID=1888 RepID=UPI0037033361